MRATGSVDELARLGRDRGGSRSEGERFTAREAIADTCAPWFAARGRSHEIGAALDRNGVPWGRYQTFTELVADDPRCSTGNPMFADVDHPGIGST